MNKVVYRRRELEDLRGVPYNPRHTREFKAHINVKRTNGGGAVAYLMGYTFKPPKCTPVQMNTEQEQNAQQRQQGNNTVRNDIRTYMRARRIGAIEAFWRLLEFRNVSISPSVEAYSLHLPGLHMHLIHNPNVSRGPVATQSSSLKRYFARPVQYRENDIFTYMETLKLRKTLPKSLRADEANIPRDAGVPSYFVTKRIEKHPVVGRIRYVSPSNVELFAFRLLVLISSPRSFEEALQWDGKPYLSFQEAAIAAGLYVDGNEVFTAFDEAVRICMTPDELRRMVVTLYMQAADSQRIFERHEEALYANIMLQTPELKKKR